MDLKKEIINLISKTATELPEDVVLALKKARQNEKNPTAKHNLKVILKNIKLAKGEKRPICQDTGTPIFYVEYNPKEYAQKELKRIIEDATNIATLRIPLRPNAVDCLTGKGLGNKPLIHFEEAEELKINLMLKGGGSENVSAIYQLPNKELNADRNPAGVEKCVLDAVFRAQGKGCPPYIAAAAIGGAIDNVAFLAKKQLLRNINDRNKDKALDELEKRLLEKINRLEIGPMGLGGKTTALSVKIAGAPRHPASYFVAVSFSCWCARRQAL